MWDLHRLKVTRDHHTSIRSILGEDIAGHLLLNGFEVLTHQLINYYHWCVFIGDNITSSVQTYHLYKSSWIRPCCCWLPLLSCKYVTWRLTMRVWGTLFSYKPIISFQHPLVLGSWPSWRHWAVAFHQSCSCTRLSLGLFGATYSFTFTYFYIFYCIVSWHLLAPVGRSSTQAALIGSRLEAALSHPSFRGIERV